MKKWIALLMAFAMLLGLVSCTSAPGFSASLEEEEEITVIESEAEPEEEPAAEEPAEAPEEEAEEPESEPAGFTNPLTGESTETDISVTRPLAVMLNTLKKALPQSGCGSADLLFEIPEEGGITRIMAVFQDPTGVGNLGTIRSTREYFVYLAMGLDAILAHAGASYTATDLLNASGYGTLDYMTHESLYWRDPDRKANVGLEHSLYTSSDNLQDYLAGTTKIRTIHDAGYTVPFSFTEDGTPAGGSSAAEINVSFSGYKETHFTYDAATGQYNVFAFGEPYVDENTGEQVAVTNVVVIPTGQSTKEDGLLQEFDLSGGTGYFACGGQYIQINWEKGGDSEALRFYNTDGTALELGVGSTYICICGTSRPIDFS